MKSGIELIADERNRQITVKNRTVQSDVEVNKVILHHIEVSNIKLS